VYGFFVVMLYYNKLLSCGIVEYYKVIVDASDRLIVVYNIL